MNELPPHAVGYVQIGMIIGQVNIIETSLNWIIAEYYTGVDDSSELNMRFQSEVLNSGMIRLEDKLKILKQIVANKGLEFPKKIDEDIKEWRRVRNIVAHGVPMNSSEGGIFILNNNEYHDIEKLRKGFGKRQDRIVDFIHTLLPEKNRGK